MKQNVGTGDRIIRIIVGLAVCSLIFIVNGNARYFGLLGIIPLLTGLIGWCPLYMLLGINTRHRE